MEWEKGRQLKKLTKPDGTVLEFTYNGNGIRTSKTVDGVKHDYILDGTTILRESWGENCIVPLYDNEESVCGIVYNDTPYFFLKNQQGDVIAITNGDGDVVAHYTYDAWGKGTIVTDTTDCNIANINPYRYRGYYYDTETGLYYLQSRYYDPETGRFINADEAEFAIIDQFLLKHNLFCYCGNEPGIRADYYGTDAIILQSQESVFNFGHMGLLFEYNKIWYYWYWGLHSTLAPFQYAITALALLGGTLYATALTGSTVVFSMLLSYSLLRTLSKTVLAQYHLVKVCGSNAITKKTTLSNIHKKLGKAKAEYSGIYERGLYLEGNFSKAYNYLKVYTILRAYNLLYNNCMQTSLSALFRGNFKSNNAKNHLRLAVARNMIVPKLAYNYLSKFFFSLAWN